MSKAFTDRILPLDGGKKWPFPAKRPGGIVLKWKINNHFCISTDAHKKCSNAFLFLQYSPLWHWLAYLRYGGGGVIFWQVHHFLRKDCSRSSSWSMTLEGKATPFLMNTQWSRGSSNHRNQSQMGDTISVSGWEGPCRPCHGFICVPPLFSVSIRRCFKIMLHF